MQKAELYVLQGGEVKTKFSIALDKHTSFIKSLLKPEELEMDLAKIIFFNDNVMFEAENLPVPSLEIRTVGDYLSNGELIRKYYYKHINENFPYDLSKEKELKDGAANCFYCGLWKKIPELGGSGLIVNFYELEGKKTSFICCNQASCVGQMWKCKCESSGFLIGTHCYVCNGSKRNTRVA